MADEGQIKHNTLSEPGFSDRTKKELESLVPVLDKIEKAVVTVAHNLNEEFGKFKVTGLEDLDRLNKLTADLRSAEEKLTAAKKESAAVKKRIKDLTDEELKNNIREQADAKKRKDSLRDLVILQDKQAGVLDKLLAKNRQLARERAAITKLDTAGKAAIKAINDQIDINNRLILENSDKLKKQRMSVGGYAEGIREALRDSDAFNDVLGKAGPAATIFAKGMGAVSKSIKQVAKDAENGDKKSQSFLKILKGFGLASVIVGLGSVKEAMASTADGAEALDKWGNRANTTFGILIQRFASGNFSGVLDQIERANKASDEMTKRIYELRRATRALSIEEHDLTLNLEDYVKISNDATRSFKDRNEAQEKSFELERKRADVALKLAQKQKEAADAEVKRQLAIIGTNDLSRVNAEVLDKQADAIKAVATAQDNLNDLELDQGIRLRQRIEEEVSLNIELLRSKKKSSTAQHDLLMQQVSDEKIQLEERKKIALQLQAVNQNTYKEQASLIQEAFDKERESLNQRKKDIPFDILLQEKNNIVLAEKIKKLGLSVGLTEALATIIKKTQDAEIEANTKITQIDEALIKRKQRIYEIEAEIFAIRRQEQLDTINNQIKGKERDFDKQTHDQKIRGLKEINTLNALAESQEQKQIIEKYDLEKKRIDANVHDSQIAAKEKEKIDAQMYYELGGLAEKYKDKQISIEQQIREERKKQIEEIHETFNTFLDAMDEASRKRSDAETRALEEDLARREKAVDYQRERYEKGLTSQLDFEERERAKAEVRLRQQREREAARENGRELKKIFLNFLAEFIKGEPNSANVKAFAATAAAKGIAEGFGGGLYEGTEKVGPEHALFDLGTDKDPFVTRLHPGEKVFGVDDAAIVPEGMTNRQVAIAARMVHNGLVVRDDQPIASMGFASEMAIGLLRQDLAGVKKAIEEKPVPHTSLDGLGNWTDEIETKTRRMVTKHVNKISIKG